MNNHFTSSELVLAPNGSLYHIHLKPHQLADNIILVGDPNRVEEVSKFFDEVIYKESNREIITHTGLKNGVEITVMSTGMGTDNIDIVVTELDACVNIDLNTREIKQKKRNLNIIRIGTSGSLQEDIPCGGYVASKYAIGLDGIMYFYKNNLGVIDNELTGKFVEDMNWSGNLPMPYGVECSQELLEKIGFDMIQGITATSPGFYGPQGRSIRLPLAFEDINDNLSKFQYNNLRIANYEMESSALYALGKNLGHNVLTICLIIANRKKGEFLEDYHNNMNELIEKVVNRLVV